MYDKDFNGCPYCGSKNSIFVTGVGKLYAIMIKKL